MILVEIPVKKMREFLFIVVALSCSPSLAAPSAPVNFTLSPVPGEPRHLQATWSIPEETNGAIQNYTVSCNDSSVFSYNASGYEIVDGGEMRGSTGLPAADVISVTLGNLDPFTMYECTVSATTNGGVGIDSEPSVATTEQDGKEEIFTDF